MKFAKEYEMCISVQNNSMDPEAGGEASSNTGQILPVIKTIGCSSKRNVGDMTKLGIEHGVELLARRSAIA